MKALIGLFSLVALMMFAPQLSAQKKDAAATKADIQVYYFHNTRRCETCTNVERQAKLALNQLYPE
ncbi:MAG: hypothetical protein IH599_08785, partial [Bacteroidales bacterium]|nr:hypothetical protein [Bacteroidales bacterium]